MIEDEKKIYKIYFAIGNEGLENFIKSSANVIKRFLKKDISFVGETVYREGILSGIKDFQPDLIIINEGLSGNTEIKNIIYNIRKDYPYVRIIFMAGDRDAGDSLLATITQYGVYDLIIGSKINAKDIVKHIIYPSTLAEVEKFIPKISVDEKTKNKIFEAPDIKPVTINTHDSLFKDDDTVTTGITPIKNMEKTLSEISKKEENTSKDIDYNEEKEDILEDALKPIDEPVQIPIPEKKTEPQIIQKPEPIITPKDEEQVKLKVKPIKPIKTIIKEEIPKPETVDDINNVENRNRNIEVESIVKPEKVKPEKIKQEKIKQEKEKSNKLFSGLFSGDKSNKTRRIGQQIITFMGGYSGVGNSQLAFNTALSLSNKGYKVIYMDLNDIFSSIDCIFQLGYTDVGIDTAIDGIVNEDYNLVDRSISNMSKILPNTSVDNCLYETYTKIPTNIDFLFFSQNYMTRNEENYNDIKKIDKGMIKDLLMYLMMEKGYDFIIADVPYNIYDKITSTLLTYTSKIFFTITQDVAVLTNHVNNIKILNKKRINYSTKFYYLLNKYENFGFKAKDIYEFLVDNTRIDDFDMISVPNINKDFMVNNYLGSLILLNTKSKEFTKSISNIENLIIQ